MNLTRLYHILAGALLLPAGICAQDQAALRNRQLDIEWQQGKTGYRIVKAAVANGSGHTPLEQPSGEYTVLYSDHKPDSLPLRREAGKRAATFPEPAYRHTARHWAANLEPVPMNTAGKAMHFFPETAIAAGDTALVFHYSNDTLQLTARWSLDARYPQDIVVTMTLKAVKPGYYALATPALATVPEQQLAWDMIPGYFQGKSLQHDLVSSYGYGQGIPDRPIIVRERTASTLCPLIQDRNGITLAVIPAPGTGRDPWEKDHFTHDVWQLGLSLMDRKGRLTPVAYHPVLGQQHSYMRSGEERTFSFRYSLQTADWYSVYKHAIYDIYRFRDFLALKQTRQSLTDRILDMLHYVKADSTSRWRMATYKGLRIGAQDYLGGVVGSDKDAMKNSDYGAMWMLAHLTGDTLLERQRLPYALNFKLVQQQQEPGFFQGAATGQYYLWKSRRFTEEWGTYVEPIALTYYTMLDVGNILLFEPGNQPLRERLRLGADKLLQWQHADGHWEVAYDHSSTRPLFTDLQDLRPTFYGLLVAYRILGDKKYLAAARKGADWFVREATDRGYFLGVCGDARFVADFATGQSVQALLDLYDLTGEQRYRDAAIATARIYTASIYTHPIPSRQQKTVNGVPREDWEISQAGLSFEHGGSLGSATSMGPILLASHAGMFVRLFSMTQDSLYLDMARAAALGRDAFVDQPTGVASYYWKAMNKGAGPYPHHAWWQIGWITDYLLSEAALRSGGKITFPRGFITPKVGPHQCYGFAPGQVFGHTASLYLPDSMLQVGNPFVDHMSAIDTASKQLYVLLLNDDDETRQTSVRLDLEKVLPGKKVQLTIVRLLDHKGQRDGDVRIGASQQVTIPPYGLKVLLFSYTPADTQYVAQKHWVCVNQWGYNSNAPKRFTVPTAAQESLHFWITRQHGTEKLYEGTVQNGTGDFTGFQPADPGPYIVHVESSRLPGAASYPFEIGPFVLERMAAQPSIDFMNDCRSITGTHPSAYGGCPWRDGTFYSYEIPSLVLMYLSNPQQYEAMPATIDYAALKRKVLDPAFRLVKAPNDSTALSSARRYFTEIPPLTGKHIPDLMWDLHWGIGYYLVNPRTADPSDNRKPPPELHAQTLAQFAYFLYAYPWLEKWFPQSIYKQALQFALVNWEAAGLLEVRREVGSSKGRYAPGFSILPNLMMYEVCRREQQSHPEMFMEAARQQAAWIIDSLDIQDPLVTKGQRMSEHMLMTGLAFYQLHYPDAAPAGLQQKINEWADIVIGRSGNMWDFRRYDLDSNWTVPWYNEVGNVAGFPASALQAATLITDTAKRHRLLEIAFAHFDNLYGRNPLNVFTAHHPELGFTGVEKGFPKGYHEDVCARLELVRGALSCLPGTEMYPFNPAGSYRHLEGWVNHNTAWNVSLAMLNWFDNQPLSLTRQEKGLAVRWQAPVNDNTQARDSLPLTVYINGREVGMVSLVEEGMNSLTFAALLPLRGNALMINNRQVKVRKGDVVRLAYGRGILEKGMELGW